MFKKRTKRGNSSARVRTGIEKGGPEEGLEGDTAETGHQSGPRQRVDDSVGNRGSLSLPVETNGPRQLGSNKNRLHGGTAQGGRTKLSLTELQSRYSVVDLPGREDDSLALAGGSNTPDDELEGSERLKQIRLHDDIDVLEENSDDEWEQAQLKRLGRRTLAGAAAVARPSDIPTIESAVAALDARVAELAAETADLAARADALEAQRVQK